MSFSKVLHHLCKAEVIVNAAGEKRQLGLGGDGARPGVKLGLSGVKTGSLQAGLPNLMTLHMDYMLYLISPHQGLWAALTCASDASPVPSIFPRTNPDVTVHHLNGCIWLETRLIRKCARGPPGLRA